MKLKDIVNNVIFSDKGAGSIWAANALLNTYLAIDRFEKPTYAILHTLTALGSYHLAYKWYTKDREK